MDRKRKKAMNEEEVKNKILVPYLKNLGLTSEEVKFEEPTYIRFTTQARRGRSDILCKSEKANLFLIEIKAEKEKITDEVIEQGMSYSRLIHPMPPFMIVTNGKDTKVFDVISFEDITGRHIGKESDYWRNGLRISVKEELELRYQAIKNFIGYSEENLKVFSLSQTQDRMRPLKGDAADLNKKYITELFLAREDLIRTFTEFLSSEYPLFSIIGESGVGKTNFICDLTERFSDKFIILFFNGTLLSGKIFENIRDDFNWFFSPHLEETQIIERLDSLAKSTQTKVIIFIDAIDEVPSKNFNVELNYFVNRISSYDDIKICLSCKSSIWGDFLKIRGIPTFLNELLYPSEKYNIRDFEKEERKERVKALKRSLKGYEISRFTDDELDVLNDKYKRLFKYKGSFKGNIRSECRLGFMLRVVAEVYEGKQLPSTINDTKLLREYLEQKIERTGEKQLAFRCICKVGKLLFDNEVSGNYEQRSLVDERVLVEQLGLSANEKILPELFSFNILYRQEDFDGINFIGFYYTPIRDFVVSNYVLNLPRLNKNEFKNLIPKLMTGPIGQSALYWYIYSTDNKAHKKALMNYSETRALSFITEYIKIIQEKFPNLKQKFEPYTLGKVGIVINPTTSSYGFRPLKSDSQNIVLVLSTKEKGLKESSTFFSSGVSVVRRRGSNSYLENTKTTAIEEIKEQLLKIIENGSLNEEKNTFLAIEKIIAILYFYGNEIKFPLRKNSNYLLKRPIFLSFNKEVFPISCQDVLNKVKFFYAKIYYEEEERKKYFKKKYKEGTRVRVFDYKLLNHEKINKKAKIAVKEDISIPKPEIYGDFPPCEVLMEAVRTVQKKQDKIIDYYLPIPDVPLKKVKQEKLSHGLTLFSGKEELVRLLYSEKQLKKYIEEFFKKFIDEYRIIVETNFSAFSKKFTLFSFQPIHFCIEAKWEGDDKGLKYGYRKSCKGKDIFEVQIEPKFSKLAFDNTEFEDIRRYLSIGCIFPPYIIPITLDRRYNTREADEVCVLRGWVYKYIRDEIKQIIDFVEF